MISLSKNRYVGTAIILLAFLRLLVCYMHGILVSLKSATLIMSNHSMSEVILVIRGAFVLPASILSYMLYVKLIQHFKLSTLFYGIVCFFIVFWALYAFVLYPYQDQIIPSTLVDKLTLILGRNHQHWVASLRYWMHVLFFLMEELWTQMIVSVMYWGFVNNICSIQQAKKFYSFFISCGVVGLIASALSIVYYSQRYTSYVYVLQILISHVIVCAIISMILFRWAHTLLGTKMVYEDYTTLISSNRGSLLFGLRHIFLSPYLVCLAVVATSINFCQTLLEGTLESYVRGSVVDITAYRSAFAYRIFFISILALVGSFIAGKVVQKFGWMVMASIGPITAGLGCLFFVMSYFKNSMLSSYIGNYIPIIDRYIIIFGYIEVIMLRAVGLTFYEEIVQIAYIPLNHEEKTEGKAAIDMVSTRFGKAGSSWLQLILLAVFRTNDIQKCSGVLAFILFVIVIIWYKAISFISGKLTLFERDRV